MLKTEEKPVTEGTPTSGGTPGTDVMSTTCQQQKNPSTLITAGMPTIAQGPQQQKRRQQRWKHQEE
jgi:hypothetical protein